MQLICDNGEILSYDDDENGDDKFYDVYDILPVLVHSYYYLDSLEYCCSVRLIMYDVMLHIYLKQVVTVC